MGGYRQFNKNYSQQAVNDSLMAYALAFPSHPVVTGSDSAYHMG